MPIYEYECSDCKKVFIIALSLKNHDEKKVVCPGCGSKTVVQMISSFTAKTACKS